MEEKSNIDKIIYGFADIISGTAHGFGDNIKKVVDKTKEKISQSKANRDERKLKKEDSVEESTEEVVEALSTEEEK